MGVMNFGALESSEGFPPYQIDFFPDIASGVFPQLPANQSFFYNQPLVAPQLGPVGYFNADGQQAQISFFDYSQFAGDETLNPVLPLNF
jgi:hypothetical protein